VRGLGRCRRGPRAQGGAGPFGVPPLLHPWGCRGAGPV